MAIISQAGKADNVIWNRIITEFSDYVKNTIEYDYNEISDIVRVVDNILAIPTDSQKYFILRDENNDLLNKVISYDSNGIEIFNYSPVYKDRIIFTDTTEEIPNYIFQDLNIHENKEPIIIQREEGNKYNNSMLGDFGITLFESGFDNQNLNQQPCINFMIDEERNIPLWDRRNQPKSTDKSLIYNFLLTTTNNDIFNDETPYTSLEDLQLIIKYLWGKYMSLCVSKYKNRIADIKYNGSMVNEVEHRPSIIYNLSITINYI